MLPPVWAALLSLNVRNLEVSFDLTVTITKPPVCPAMFPRPRLLCISICDDAANIPPPCRNTLFSVRFILSRTTSQLSRYIPPPLDETLFLATIPLVSLILLVLQYIPPPEVDALPFIEHY